MQLLALDFDGVVCDSAAETARSGWLAARRIWSLPERMPAGLLAAFRTVRPALHTGWQSVLLVRLLLDGIAPKAILQDTDGRLLQQCLDEYCLTADKLKALFGNCRDEWIAADRDDWLAAHGSYDGIVEALRVYLASGGDLVIVTTKQKRFACLLLASFGLTLAESTVYGLEAGAKAEVLRRQLATGRHDGAIFVEDRLLTLREPSLLADDRLQLWLADWGYLLPADRDAADREVRVERKSLGEFCRWLRGAEANG